MKRFKDFVKDSHTVNVLVSHPQSNQFRVVKTHKVHAKTPEEAKTKSRSYYEKYGYDVHSTDHIG